MGVGVTNAAGPEHVELCMLLSSPSRQTDRCQALSWLPRRSWDGMWGDRERWEPVSVEGESVIPVRLCCS